MLTRRGKLVVGLLAGLFCAVVLFGVDAVTPRGVEPCSQWAPC